MHGKCAYAALPEEELDKICKRDEALRRKLEAKGYCTYGHGVVGKTGGLEKEIQKSQPGRRHCYKFD